MINNIMKITVILLTLLAIVAVFKVGFIAASPLFIPGGIIALLGMWIEESVNKRGA